jgi:hypothetical protein
MYVIKERFFDIGDGENHLLILCAVLAMELAVQREKRDDD